MLADGYWYATISERPSAPRDDRHVESPLSGRRYCRMRGRHRGSRARVLTPQREARILSWTRKPPTDGRRIGRRDAWAGVWRFSTRLLPERGSGPACNRIDWCVTSARPMRISRPRLSEIIGLYIKLGHLSLQTCQPLEGRVHLVERNLIRQRRIGREVRLDVNGLNIGCAATSVPGSAEAIRGSAGSSDTC